MTSTTDGVARGERTSVEPTFVEVYEAHYTRLVRVAWLLVRDAGRAEELVQDAFVDLHQRWSRLQDRERAAGYLHRSVVNRSRSLLRHLSVVSAHLPDQSPDADSAETGALRRLAHQQVVDRLTSLPKRQREVLVLRYYGQLSEAEIAGVLKISRGAVKSHSSRALAALRPVLERT